MLSPSKVKGATKFVISTKLGSPDGPALAGWGGKEPRDRGGLERSQRSLPLPCCYKAFSRGCRRAHLPNYPITKFTCLFLKDAPRVPDAKNLPRVLAPRGRNPQAGALA